MRSVEVAESDHPHGLIYHTQTENLAFIITGVSAFLHCRCLQTLTQPFGQDITYAALEQ